MAKAHFTTLAIAAWLTASTQSPIVLGNSNMPGNNDSLGYTDVQVSSLGNYTQTGANFKWDFSKVVPTSEGVRTFISASKTPYFFLFFGSNAFGEKVASSIGAGPLTFTDYYNFYRKQTTPTNAFVVEGVGMTYSSLPIPSFYWDKDELYIFPMTYPQYDSTSFRFSTPNTTLIPVRYSKTGYRVTKVDGWGTITTPFGTESCLRLVTTQYSQDSIANTIIPFPFGFPNHVRSYQWLTLNSKIPFLEVTGNLLGNNFTPTLARHRGSLKEKLSAIAELSLHDYMVYPNPASDHLSISNGPKAGFLEVFDSSGRLVLKANENEVASGQIDISALEAGVYFINVTGQRPVKFVKE